MGNAHSLDNDPGERVDVGSATILVVEDEVLLRLMVSDLLRGHGYNVVEAANADEALSILQSGTAVHVVFTDVHMPGSLDGIGLARSVCAAFPELLVIVTSGQAASTELDDKISGFFPKPCDIQKLIQHIRSYFESRSTPSTVVKP